MAKEDTGGGQAPADGGEAPVVMRIGALLNRVAEVTGTRRQDVRPAVESALAEMGAALSRGEVLVLPGLGRVWVTKTAERGGRMIHNVKIRALEGGNRADSDDEPLADAEDAG